MAFDYTGLKLGVVEPLIADFGKILGDAWLISPGVKTGPAYDPQTATSATVPVDVVQTRFTKDNNNGTLVEKDDVLFLVSTKGVTIDPILVNQIHVDGVTYEVIRVDPLRPGPIIMLWKVHARK